MYQQVNRCNNLNIAELVFVELFFGVANNFRYIIPSLMFNLVNGNYRFQALRVPCHEGKAQNTFKEQDAQ
jgi:hypothetical protein